LQHAFGQREQGQHVQQVHEGQVLHSRVSSGPLEEPQANMQSGSERGQEEALY